MSGKHLLATFCLTVVLAVPGTVAAQEQNRTDAPVQLEDVTVTGRTLDQLISNFVDEVAEPNRYRGLAIWERRICVGVANLKGDMAQYLVDRVSTVAEDLGLEPDAPGCDPNILIIATADGGSLARKLVDERRRAFIMGGAGMDRGGDALVDFQEADRPVRWWQMSMPVDRYSGQRAVRFPGECSGSCLSSANYAPRIGVFSASRLHSQIVDRLLRTVVIVDVDDVFRLSAQQLADYVAMISLAQIDPDADTRSYASILNVFDEPDVTPSLTDWDLAYLRGIYASQGRPTNRIVGKGVIRAEIRRAHQQLTSQDITDD